MTEVGLSNRAIEDLGEIRVFLNAIRSGAGDSMVDSLARRFRALSDFPRSGHVSPDWPFYRRLIHRNYHVFYSHRAGLVRIERVISGRRDVLAALFDTNGGAD